MKKILLILLFFTLSLYAHPLEWITQEFKDFRTYPRIDKAYKQIEKGNNKEARKLLEKALGIDEKNLKALRPLVSICLAQSDYECIQNQMDNSYARNDAYFQFVLAQMYIHKDEYQKAFDVVGKSLKADDLSFDDRKIAKFIYIEAALHLKRYDEATVMGKSLRKVESKDQIAVYQLYLIQLGFNINQLKISDYLINNYMKEGNKPSIDTLSSWSVGYENHQEYDKALSYTLMLPQDLERYKREVILYQQNNDFKSASLSMEKIYQLNPTKNNQKKLLYLYEKADEFEKLKKYYISLLKNGCNANSVNYLISIENEKEYWLEKLYPYECLKNDDRFEYQMTYLQYLISQHQKKKANLKLEQIKPNSHKQHTQVATLYLLLEKYDKTISYSKSSIEKGSSSTQNYDNLGFSYAKLNKIGLATFYYEKSFNINPTIEISNTLSYLYATSNQPEMALKYLQKDKSRINSFDYHYLKYLVAINDDDKSEQLLELRHMLKYLNDDKHYAQYALLLDTYQQDRKSAIENMERALALNPKNLKYLRQLSFWYQDFDINKSIQYVKQVINKEHNNPNNYEQLANLHLINNEKTQANKAFKLAIDKSVYENKKYNLKRSVLLLEKQFDGYFSYGTRLDKDGIYYNKTSPLENANYNGFMSFELAYRPEVLENRMAFYGRILGNVKDRTLSLESSTIQQSLGIRTKLFEDKNIYLSFEKMFHHKDFSRDDEMLRLSGSFLDSYEYTKFKKRDFYNSLYSDAAYFFENESVSLYGNYEWGYIYPMFDKVSFMPYLTSGALYSDDNEQNDSTTRFDVGIGISLLTWHNETKYKADSITSRLKLEFRTKYAGNTQDDKTTKLQLEVLF